MTLERAKQMTNTVTENEFNPYTDDPLFSAVEAAAYLGVSKSTFAKHRRQKAFPVIRFMDDDRFRRSDLNCFINEHQAWGLFNFEGSN